MYHIATFLLIVRNIIYMKLFEKLKIGDVIAIFFPKNFNEKYRYLGYTYIPYKEGSQQYNIVLEFYNRLDKKVRPGYCPKIFLRFLELFGNDNSIVRVRNWGLHNLFNKITKGYRVRDCKTKWSESDIRIYGSFDDELDDLIDIVEEKIIKSYK